MEKFKTLNDLTLTITKGEEELVNEGCCSALTICLNNDGDVFTSFVGAYNPEIIKLLQKVQRKYYKSLIARLKKENREEVNNLTKKAEITEDNTPAEPQKEKVKKAKKVHERDNTQKSTGLKEEVKPKQKEKSSTPKTASKKPAKDKIKNTEVKNEKK